MRLRTKGMPESTATFSVEGSWRDVQPNERVYTPRGGRQPQCRPVPRGRPAQTQRLVQLPKVRPRTVRPTERSPRAQNSDAKSRGTRDNTVRLRLVEPARVQLRHTAPSHHSFLTRRIDWRNSDHTDHPISYLDTLIKTGSESTEAIIRRKRILFAEVVARMEDTRLPKCVMFRQMVGGAGCVGGQENKWMGCLLDDLRTFGINVD